MSTPAPSPENVSEAASEQHTHARRLLWGVLKAEDAQQPNVHAVARGIRDKIALESDWEDEFNALSNTWAKEMLAKADEAIIYAQTEWKLSGYPDKEQPEEVAKADSSGNSDNGNQYPSVPPVPPPPELIAPLSERERVLAPNAEEVKRRLTVGIPAAPMEQGAQQIYLGLADKTTTASGQSALEKLGLNKTFAWAHPRNMAQDFYQVRGSKVIQQMYGDHIDTLRNLIVDATNPRHPRTVQEVKAAIDKQWAGLRRYQVSRIARTETAALWTSTSMSTYQANGITRWNSILAHGPSIPGSDEYNPQATIQTEEPCDECLEMADAGPYSIDDPDLPPWHPNCRCEAVPVLENEDGSPWLPPAEPWAGGGGFDASANDVSLARSSRSTTDSTGCIDFDGVICDSRGGSPYGPPTVEDRPIEGAIEFLNEVALHFSLVVLSARASEPLAAQGIKTWLMAHGLVDENITVTDRKPPARWYLDDRGIQFDGVFPSIEELTSFEPWWKQEEKPSTPSPEDIQRQAIAEEPSISPDVEAAVYEPGYLTKQDTRIKSVEGIDRKLQERPGLVRDALRYMVVYPTDAYWNGVRSSFAKLKSKGYSVTRNRNYWDKGDETYAGVNTVFRAPSGYQFEVQFHTPQSVMANQTNRVLFQQRQPGFEEAMRQTIADVPVPGKTEDRLSSIQKRLNIR